MEKEQVDRSVEGRTLTGNSNDYPPAAVIGILNRVVLLVGFHEVLQSWRLGLLD